jgi:2,5-diketo-D-gluconate reductase A
VTPSDFPTELPAVLLNDGRRIPQLGFGTYLIPRNETAAAVSTALAAGYRHLDTARCYRNEAGVGEAVLLSGLPRDDVWITSKLPIGASTAVDVDRAVDATLAELGTHVDLYLIHWPTPSHDHLSTVWRALQAARADGRLRSIGVSNFHQAQLDRILDDGGTRPAVNQIEAHPHMNNNVLARRCVDLGIAVEAWSPLGVGSVLRDSIVRAIAVELDRSPAQVVLRWHLQRQHIVLPKASSSERIHQNAALHEFSLNTAQMSRIDQLDRGPSGRTGPDPETM